MTEKKNLDYYRLIAENANDMIRILDPNFKIEYINEAAHLNILGFTKDEIIGKFVLDFIHPKDREEVIKFVRKNIKRGEGSIEFRTKKKNGNYLWVKINGRLIENEYGNMRFLIISRDIDKQKKLELKLKRSERALKIINYELEQNIKVKTKELQQSEKKYRDLFETSPNPILLVDMKGVIVDCNQSTIDRYGYSREELINKHFKNLNVYQNVDLTWLITKFIEIFKTRMVDPIEIQLVKKSGEISWAKINGSLIESGDKILYQAILQDITENKETELELLNLSNLKSEILNTVSHELKTPLVSIKGFTNLLLDLKSKNLDEESISMLQTIDNGCERIQSLINNLLESSKLESSEIILNRTYEDLTSLLLNSIKDIKPLADFKNQQISINIQDNLKTYLEKDKILMVIVNLLKNAITYSPHNSKIIVSTQIKENIIIISVEDNGFGFTKNEKRKIFKQFGKINRKNPNGTQYIEGSGLGLYISKKIIELHGGKIWMESKGRNKGSTFHFSLPILSNS